MFICLKIESLYFLEMKTMISFFFLSLWNISPKFLLFLTGYFFSFFFAQLTFFLSKFYK